MPAATIPSAPTVEIPITIPRFKFGRTENNTPAPSTAKPIKMNATAPASLLIARVIRENAMMMTPRPTAAMTGNSIGCNSRLRNDALYDLSLDARSDQPKIDHSNRLAKRTTTPSKNTAAVVIVPARRMTKPAAVINGHIDDVGASSVAATPASPTSPSRVDSTNVVISAVAATAPSNAVAPIADSSINNM